MKIEKRDLYTSKPIDVKRLAKSLNVRNVDEMSHRQLCRFLYWLFTRKEKRERFIKSFGSGWGF
jgi:hypothetical protein